MSGDFKDTYPTTPIEYGCRNFCHGGRKKCPTPQACEIPEEAVNTRVERVFWMAVVAIYAIILAALFT